MSEKLPKKPRKIFVVMLVGAVSLSLFYRFGRSVWGPVYSKVAGRKTVAEVISEVGPEARERLAPHFERAGVEYPPKQLTMLAIKDTAKLEIWAGSKDAPVFITTYPVLAASGKSGPKLREGDRQVPEGFYKIEGLNPNSSYHLSMKLDYPNAFDLEHARDEGRTSPGSDIFIHGKAVSIGCLAMGDPAIEELFVLVSDVGRENVQVIIAPTDPREHALTASDGPAWLPGLYKEITGAFAPYKR